jgi:hypothetical protein
MHGPTRRPGGLGESVKGAVPAPGAHTRGALGSARPAGRAEPTNAPGVLALARPAYPTAAVRTTEAPRLRASATVAAYVSGVSRCGAAVCGAGGGFRSSAMARAMRLPLPKR